MIAHRLNPIALPNPKIAVPLALGAVLLAVASANPLLTLGSLSVMAVLTMLLWRPGEPPALLYAMGYHWMQASILILYGNSEGQRLASMGYGALVEQATWLTLIGLVVISLGMRIGAGRMQGPDARAAVIAITRQLSVQRLFFVCLLAIALALVAGRAAYIIPGLVQPILALVLLRWVAIFIFTYTVLAQRRGYRYLATVLLIELLIGFLGFFSDFKTVLIVALLAALTSPAALKGIRFRTAGLLVAAILALGVLWTGVKSDYRQFLNQGTGQQTVLVPVEARVAKLGELVGQMTAERLGESIVALVERVTYVYYFGQAMEMVPAYIDHENGLLWREAVEGALVPRLLNPSKRIIDDSQRTSYYTGSRVAGAEEGTSISLGYVAESYIDFGPYLMMGPLLLWGLFVGFAYRALTQYTRYPLWGYASAAVLVGLGVAVLEQSNLKMVASFLLGLVVLLLAQKLLAGRVLALLAYPAGSAAASVQAAGSRGLHPGPALVAPAAPPDVPSS